MSTVGSAMESELRRLRKGHGVLSRGLRDRVGPELSTLAGLSATDSDPVIRTKLHQTLQSRCRDLPADLELAVLAALAIHPRTRHRFLSDRLVWVAEELHADERTARRRMDEGFRRLCLQQEATTSVVQHPVREDWYFQSFRTVLRLDQPSPEAYEQRTIVSNVENLTELETSFSLPRRAGDSSGTHSLNVEMAYGGELTLVRQPTEKHFRLHIRLPRPLSAGETYEYGLVVRIPPGQPMAPHYVLTPFRSCDAFSLRVRFGRHRLPTSVWKLTAVPFVMIDDPAASEERLAIDDAGDLAVEFSDLQQGLGYGMQWQEQTTYAVTGS
jgi:hypothetical protein